MTLTDEILDIFDGRAKQRYGLAAINQLQHALQAAALAEAAGEPSAMITAALLHDVGHMIHDQGEDPAAQGVDDRHEEHGARWLERNFLPDVCEPVRLHVAAKRYLVAAEPGYADRLSADSIRSLALQGGPMRPDEVATFDTLAHADAAKRLRRYDEAAKDPRAVTPGIRHFLRHAAACARAP